jgi:hypothetical protein
MKRFREGVPTKADFDYINERVINVMLPDGSWSNPGGPTMSEVPHDAAYIRQGKIAILTKIAIIFCQNTDLVATISIFET